MSYGRDSRTTFRHRSLRERTFGRSSRTGMGSALLGLFALVAILGGIAFAASVPYTNPQTMTCTVSDKDRTLVAQGQSDMRVYTDECGVLSVKDMIFAGQFRSADTFNDIEVGTTYEFKVTGYRFGPLSMFPIIREVNEVQKDAETPAEASAGVQVGDTLSTVTEVNSVAVGAVLRAEGVNFERVADGFQIVGTTDVKPAEYVASFAPLTVAYLP